MRKHLSSVASGDRKAFTSPSSKGTNRRVRFAWVPIPLFLLLILHLNKTPCPFVFEPPFLLALLNFTFSTAVSIFVAYLAALGFSRNASPPVLLLGCGMLFFGIVSLIAAIAIHFKQINFALTVYNTGVCLSGACHLLAAAASISFDRRINRYAILVLSIAYTSVFILTGILIYAALEGLTPVYFNPGEGSTQWRQVVLGTAVGLFGMAGMIIALVSRKYRWNFGYWYALSLGLIATGLFGVLMIKAVGSPLGWTGRAAQYLGGIYMFGAVLVAARESGEWDAALQVALRESEERYRVLAEATFEGIVIVENGTIVDTNEQLARMLGYAEKEVIGKRIDELIPADMRERVMTDMASGPDMTQEYHLIRKDGKPITVESHCRNLSRNGRQIGYVAMRDITERRKVEQALRKSDERLRLAADGAEVGMWYWDIAADELELNEQIYCLFGLPRESTLSLVQLQQFILPEDLAVVREITAEALSTGGLHEIQYRITRPDGRLRWLLAKGFTRLDVDGSPVINLGVLMDITERKTAEDALQERERLFRTIVENSRDGIHQFDLINQRYVFMSPAQEKLTGFSVDALMLTMGEAAERLHPEDRERVGHFLEQLMAGKEMNVPMEYRWRIRSGEYRWFSDIRSIIRDDRGRPVALVGNSRDITEQKQAEEELQKSRDELELRVNERTAELRKRAEQLARLSSELTMSEQRERKRLAQVLHDHLQQLLAGAKLQLEALAPELEGEQEERVQKIVGYMVESLKATRSLTMELSPPILQKEGLPAALKWLADWMEETHGLSVDLRADAGAELEREDLRILVFHSIRELLFNIVKHSGVRHAVVELRPADEDGVQVIVEDNGRGFEMDEVLNENRACGGFGLFSIRERLLLIGGRFDIVSEIGSGTRFTMVLPIKPSVFSAAMPMLSSGNPGVSAAAAPQR